MKRACVTGGNRGIGRATAIALAQDGYDIAFTYLFDTYLSDNANDEKAQAEAVSQQIKKLGRKCYCYPVDLSIDGVAEETVQRAIKDLGGIDVMVCNAGVTKAYSILDITEDDIDFLCKLNYRSYLMCTQVAAGYMKEHKIAGTIVWTSSVRGVCVHMEDLLYGGLKAALNRSLKSIAMELAEYNITINAVAPGATAVRGQGLTETYISTVIPLKRMGAPEEIAGVIAFLVSEKAQYITGEVITIDGGLSLPGQKEHP